MSADIVYLWLLSQSSTIGCDTFDSCIVAACSEDEARTIHPAGYRWIDGRYRHENGLNADGERTWISPNCVEVEMIGVAITAKSGEVLCANFNAG